MMAAFAMHVAALEPLAVALPALAAALENRLDQQQHGTIKHLAAMLRPALGRTSTALTVLSRNLSVRVAASSALKRGLSVKLSNTLCHGYRSAN